ncbi:hypothetical protein OG596_33470 [Streptomyces sp. NBC_01102]|nr:hypothetical protein OG596_33470 [Streptomyces sp. NBC_01102]
MAEMICFPKATAGVLGGQSAKRRDFPQHIDDTASTFRRAGLLGTLSP